MRGYSQALVCVLLLACTLNSTGDQEQVCSGRGNFNLDRQQCECPWGYDGKDCEQLLLPACRTSRNATSFSCADTYPQNCACLRQCWAIYCGAQPAPEQCEVLINKQAKCYEYEGLPEEEQLSDMPEEGDSRARYYQGFVNDESRQAITRDEAKTIVHWKGDTVVPNSMCPQACYGRGTCVKGTGTDGLSCICHIGFEGQHCELEVNNSCFSSCTDISECMVNAGFCRCPPGRWGMGCSRSNSFPPSNDALPPATRLRIYMYDLPPRMTHGTHISPATDIIYLADRHFISKFLQDWEVRTENPHEANMFFIPAMLTYYGGNLWVARAYLSAVIKHVQQQYPFWNRTRGADHFFFALQDRGMCSYNLDNLLQDSIRVVHFGYNEPYTSTVPWWEGGSKEQADQHHWGACYIPMRDVVTTLHIADAMTWAQRTFPIHNADQPLIEPARTKLLFFAGSIRENEPHYSHGVRQAMWKLYKAGNSSDPDISVYEGRIEDYYAQIESHKFCLAPAGYGWGNRLIVGLLHGCIPVIIQDFIHQYFDDVLPYEDFSIRLGVEDIPHLGTILRNVDQQEYSRLKEGMRRWHRAFYWTDGPQPFGGLAYNYTLKSLHKRLLSNKAKLGKPYQDYRSLATGAQQEQQECPTCKDCPAPQECPKCLDGPPTPECPTCPVCPPVQECPKCLDGPPTPERPTCPVCPPVQECPTCEDCPSPHNATLYHELKSGPLEFVHSGVSRGSFGALVFAFLAGMSGALAFYVLPQRLAKGLWKGHG